MSPYEDIIELLTIFPTLCTSYYSQCTFTYYSPLQYFLPSGNDDLFALFISDLVSVSLCGFICLDF